MTEVLIVPSTRESERRMVLATSHVRKAGWTPNTTKKYAVIYFATAKYHSCSSNIILVPSNDRHIYGVTNFVLHTFTCKLFNSSSRGARILIADLPHHAARSRENAGDLEFIHSVIVIYIYVRIHSLCVYTSSSEDIAAVLLFCAALR